MSALPISINAFHSFGNPQNVSMDCMNCSKPLSGSCTISSATIRMNLFGFKTHSRHFLVFFLFFSFVMKMHTFFLFGKWFLSWNTSQLNIKLIDCNFLCAIKWNNMIFVFGVAVALSLIYCNSMCSPVIFFYSFVSLRVRLLENFKQGFFVDLVFVTFFLSLLAKTKKHINFWSMAQYFFSLRFGQNLAHFLFAG